MPIELNVVQLKPVGPEDAPSSIRFAPFRDGRLLASLWHISAQGEEIYVANRNSMNTAKASLHTGQWTFNAGTMRLKLQSPQPLPGSPWSFALKMSWLINPDARPIYEGKKIKASKITVLLTPPGYVLSAALLIGEPGGDPYAPPPPEFQPGQVIMRTTLRDTRPVIVVAVALPMTPTERTYMQGTLRRGPKWTKDQIAPDNAELCVIHGKPNYIMIIPLRKEDWTGEAEAPAADAYRAGREGSEAVEGDKRLMIVLAGKY